MNSERIKKIQEQTAYPESVSVMTALKQVWNECEQEQLAIQRVTQQSEQFFALLRYTMPDQFTDIALKNIVKGFIEQSK